MITGTAQRVVRLAAVICTLSAFFGTALADDLVPALGTFAYSSDVVLHSRSTDYVLQLPSNQSAVAPSGAVAGPVPNSRREPTVAGESFVLRVCDRILWSPIPLANVSGLQCLKSERIRPL